MEFLSTAQMNEFKGISNKLNGLIDLDKNVLDFFIDLNNINTGIGLRDRHMRENYLETKRYPFGEFVGKIKKNVDLTKGQKQKATVVGNFKIHGIEKKVEVIGIIQRSADNELVLETSFTILLTDYNIDIPKVMFLELANDQKVKIRAILK